MAKERIEPRRERLTELGITHILEGALPAPNHPSSLPRCRGDARSARPRSFRGAPPGLHLLPPLRLGQGDGAARTTSAASSAWAWRSRPRPWTSAAACSSAPDGLPPRRAATVALLMPKRGMRLSAAYGVVKLRASRRCSSRARSASGSATPPIELHHESSVVRDRTFTNPSLKQLVGELGLDAAPPVAAADLLQIVGTVVLPDAYAFWNGRPRTDAGPGASGTRAPAPTTTPRRARGSAFASTRGYYRCCYSSTRPPSAAARRPLPRCRRAEGVATELTPCRAAGVASRRLRRRHLRRGLGLRRDGAARLRRRRRRTPPPSTSGGRRPRSGGRGRLDRGMAERRMPLRRRRDERRRRRHRLVVASEEAAARREARVCIICEERRAAQRFACGSPRRNGRPPVARGAVREAGHLARARSRWRSVARHRRARARARAPSPPQGGGGDGGPRLNWRLGTTAVAFGDPDGWDRFAVNLLWIGSPYGTAKR